MIEFADISPDVAVAPAEYHRLLGYPRGYVLQDRASELAAWARAWYAEHGRPWVYVRHIEDPRAADSAVYLEDQPFHGERLRKTLQQSGAHGAIVAAISAGPELEEHAQQLWQEERPDEYFFLEIFGSAVVEHLTTMTGARLCAWAEGSGMAVLPHDSPGYVGWDVAEQPALLQLIQRGGNELASRVSALESGALRPKKSLLAVFGVTRHIERLRPLTELVPCQSCSFAPCQYRRAPYARSLEVEPEAAPEASDAIQPAAKYNVNTKALKRWAGERLTLERRPDGIDAVFVYEGTTCTNMGRPLKFHYRVRLGPREEGYPIREQQCTPAPGDTGHTYMCGYLDRGEQLMSAIARDNPLLGRRLDEVLGWQRSTFAPSCYCEEDSRQHKWGLVLETIHYALSK
jgi:hypothetical protein